MKAQKQNSLNYQAPDCDVVQLQTEKNTMQIISDPNDYENGGSGFDLD
ncbi:MAG: hypothetical protein IK113_06990 [Bacteroidales bacterium]|nr:hypothetical protein [Bacteroidales bacterium]